MAPKKPELDPDGKYLIQDGSNHIFVYSDKLAKRKDMRPYDASGKKPAIDPVTAGTAAKVVEIELQGKKFLVEQALYDLLSEMGDKWTEMQESVKTLTAEKTDFEALKVRMDTDNTDLTEQLAKANAKIAELTAPVEGPVPAETAAENDTAGKGSGKKVK
jgi:hypothetical protein